jgi:putative copper export protein
VAGANHVNVRSKVARPGERSPLPSVWSTGSFYLVSMIATMVVVAVLANLSTIAAAPGSSATELGPYVLVLLAFVALLGLAFGVALLWLRRPSKARRVKDELTRAFLDELDASPLNPSLRQRDHAVHG